MSPDRRGPIILHCNYEGLKQFDLKSYKFIFTFPDDFTPLMRQSRTRIQATNKQPCKISLNQNQMQKEGSIIISKSIKLL